MYVEYFTGRYRNTSWRCDASCRGAFGFARRGTSWIELIIQFGRRLVWLSQSFYLAVIRRVSLEL